MSLTTQPTTIAFYLPQFHPIAFNDANWGPGFTEWTNVARARPLFPGHFQPRLPGALGFYDLRCSEVIEEQANYARAYGVDAFCFYYYRFGPQRLLDRPLEAFLSHPEIRMPFMYCWANEPWTRAWDGRSGETLIQQTYDEVTLNGLTEDLGRAMVDERYLRVNGKPLFLIYQIEHVPKAAEFVENLRARLREKLDLDILIGAVFSHGFKSEMMNWLDCVVQFPPHRIPRTPESRVIVPTEQLAVTDPDRSDYFEPYESVIAACLRHARDVPQMCLGVCPDWDNSPRRRREAHVLLGSTPDLFQAWTEDAVIETIKNYETGRTMAPLLFINSWNEWGEGAMLEPSEKFGTAYLEAFQAGLSAGIKRSSSFDKS